MRATLGGGVALCALAAACAASTARAQSPSQAGNAAATPSSQNAASVQEIVVTAQKRTESISNVGMAITAATALQLKELQIRTTQDLTKLEPSFVATDTVYGTPVYIIRGVGYNDFALAAAPTVSVYQDEIPYSYLALTKGATLDVGRVEILKGPQGTLFGQNATGGAVNYIAAQPSDTLQAGLEATYARFNGSNVNGYLGGPIALNLDGRLSFDITEGGAYQRSETRNATLGNQDLKKGRLLLNWRPNNVLKVSANINGWTDNGDTLVPQVIGLTPHSTADYPNTAYANPALAGRPYTSIVGLTTEPTPTNDRQADWYSGVIPRNDEHTYQGSLRVDYDVSKALQLSYLGSYVNYRQNDLDDPAGEDLPLYLLRNGTIKTIYQELRANGKLLDNKLDWQVGASYNKADTREDDLEVLQGSTASFGYITLPVALGLSKSYLNPFSAVRNVLTDNAVSEAGYANLEYHVLRNFDVHGGLRYTNTDIQHTGCTEDVDGNLAAGTTDLELSRHFNPIVPAVQGGCVTLGPTKAPELVSQRLDQNNVSWRVGADWTPIPRTLLYATLSKGYKACSFPALTASSFASLSAVTQESLLAYEFGEKSRFAGNLIEVNSALFYYDYTNKQLQASFPDPLGIFGVLNTLVNIPKSKEEGAEFALVLRPLSGLTLNADL